MKSPEYDCQALPISTPPRRERKRPGSTELGATRPPASANASQRRRRRTGVWRQPVRFPATSGWGLRAGKERKKSGVRGWTLPHRSVRLPRVIRRSRTLRLSGVSEDPRLAFGFDNSAPGLHRTGRRHAAPLAADRCFPGCGSCRSLLLTAAVPVARAFHRAGFAESRPGSRQRRQQCK